MDFNLLPWPPDSAKGPSALLIREQREKVVFSDTGAMGEQVPKRRSLVSCARDQPPLDRSVWPLLYRKWAGPGQFTSSSDRFQRLGRRAAGAPSSSAGHFEERDAVCLAAPGGSVQITLSLRNV